MKLCVIIPTHGRKAMVNRVLALLATQSRVPDGVIVSAPDASHVEPVTTMRANGEALPVSYVFGPAGLPAQRNRALDQALANYDVITFFDDDFLPAPDYLERVAEGFANHADWAVITGHVVLDGISGPGLSFEDGLQALQRDSANRGVAVTAVDLAGAYGCNMSMRARDIGTLRFDERLPLYGWQEDTDFSRQMRRHGRIVRLGRARGVHLGVKAGRVSGVRFGYSQVSNIIYLMNKGTMPAGFGYGLMGRNLASNFVKSVWPESHVDRRGRLKGNLLAAYHLARGRVEPEFVVKLK
jgi:glycosyltransferase involved in cell wall biosynthesis